MSAMHADELIADGVGRIERRHRLLKDHGHAIAAQAGSRRGGEVLAVKGEPARAARRSCRCQVHQGERGHGFTAAGFADDAQGFAALHLERHVAYCVQDAGRRCDVDGEAIHIEERHITLSRSAL